MIVRAGRAHARPVPRSGIGRWSAAVLLCVGLLSSGVACSGSASSGDSAVAGSTPSTALPRVVSLTLSDSDESPRYRYVIEAGTGAALDAGREVSIMPPELVALKGDVIYIDNQDSRSHFIGPFYIPPGQDLQQRFDSTGRYIGFCSVYPSGQVIIEVRDRDDPTA